MAAPALISPLRNGDHAPTKRRGAPMSRRRAPRPGGAVCCRSAPRLADGCALADRRRLCSTSARSSPRRRPRSPSTLYDKFGMLIANLAPTAAEAFGVS